MSEVEAAGYSGGGSSPFVGSGRAQQMHPVATALARFSYLEYGKMRLREQERIASALQTWLGLNAPPPLPRYFLENAARDSQSWAQTIANLSPDAASFCRTAALQIARGSGRRAITQEMHRRIEVLFAGAYCENIEYTYQEFMTNLEEFEATLPPLYMREPSLRLSIELPGGSTRTGDASVAPWSMHKKGFRCYFFDSKTEQDLRYEQIASAVNLSTGEVLDHLELYRFVSPGREIPAVIAAYEARFVCWYLVSSVRQALGKLPASAKVEIHRAMNEVLAPGFVSEEDAFGLMSKTTAEMANRGPVRQKLTPPQNGICRRYAVKIMGAAPHVIRVIDEWFPELGVAA